MTDRATQQILIDAPLERCWEVAIDFDRYPEWAEDIREVDVLSRDAEGRAERVAFRTAAMGRSVRYTLAYDYSDAPRGLAWKQLDGDLTRRLDGSYVFAPADGATQVTYHLVVELRLPLPGFVKRRAEHRILGTALRELKARAEG